MASFKIFLFSFFTALVAVNLIVAQESLFEQEEEEPHDRLFFNLFPITTSCNYTTEPGTSCRSCTQALRCLSNNVGILRNCRGFLPYCNGGRCSFLPGAACTTG